MTPKTPTPEANWLPPPFSGATWDVGNKDHSLGFCRTWKSRGCPANFGQTRAHMQKSLPLHYGPASQSEHTRASFLHNVKQA